jgi:propanol-preferring alcohol dehydrogenase
MHAMALPRARAPLEWVERDLPGPGPHEVLLRVRACGVCRTDLHVVDDELPGIGHPIVPGHEIVGEVLERCEHAPLAIGARVGVPWLGWTCGVCADCRAGRENLCREARFTGWQIEGGYAEQAIADARYVFSLPERYRDEQAAPLLCAGLIGYRAYAKAGAAQRLGIYGFGAAAQLIAQVAGLTEPLATLAGLLELCCRMGVGGILGSICAARTSSILSPS